MWAWSLRVPNTYVIGVTGSAVSLGVLALVSLFTPASAVSEKERIAGILAKADTAYGEYLSGQCVTCHHVKGDNKGIPPIVGLPDVYFVQTMLEYKSASEGRTNPAMVNIAKNLSEEELASLAKHFSQQEAE